MFRKTIIICLALIMALGLAACGHEHEWADASCLTPKTCSSCQETEGEALDHTWADAICAAPKTCTACDVTEGEALEHTWADATCSAPKTCTACNATEGEALEHTWVDATYQAPKTCSVCATTEGEKLISYFEEYGLDAKLLEKSGEYELEQPCAADDTKTTVAKIIIEDYKTIVSDESHEAMDGYEWKILTIKQRFSDENARKYGGNLGMYLWANKYASGTAAEDADNTGLFEGGMRYPVMWDGVEYPDGLLHIKEDVSDWMEDDEGTRYIDITVTVSVRLPVGYDGFVFGLENAKWEWPGGTYLHENITDDTLLFCFD